MNRTRPGVPQHPVAFCENLPTFLKARASFWWGFGANGRRLASSCGSRPLESDRDAFAANGFAFCGRNRARRGEGVNRQVRQAAVDGAEGDLVTTSGESTGGRGASTAPGRTAADDDVCAPSKEIGNRQAFRRDQRLTRMKDESRVGEVKSLMTPSACR